MLKVTDEGIMIAIKVIPKSHCNEIIGWENEELKVRITAAPDKGAANEMLIKVFAKFLGLASSNVTLVYGQTSRHKRLCINGISLDKLASLLK